ncbi:MAG: polysaccharide pyruvyl transferase family protein [Parachlamydiaceae bacterium]
MLIKFRIIFKYSLILFFIFFIDLTIEAEDSFGYLSYETRNNGDDIQAIAARRFLSENAIPINREFIHDFYHQKVVNTIMNGWYMHTNHARSGWDKPRFTYPKTSWPPSQSIHPLLISIHFTQQFLPEAFSDEGIAYLKKYAPVGARDYYTLKELEKRGIPSYFSGCLTLTLENEYRNNQRKNIIYAVDINQKCLAFIKSHANCEVKSITHGISQFATHDERLARAQKLLDQYKQARCVITSRLHAALPCLAFETPVLLINSQPDQYRFEGLLELLMNCSVDDFLEEKFLFDFNHPPENSNHYLFLREKLIETVSEWVQKNKTS